MRSVFVSHALYVHLLPMLALDQVREIVYVDFELSDTVPSKCQLGQHVVAEVFRIQAVRGEIVRAIPELPMVVVGVHL